MYIPLVQRALDEFLSVIWNNTRGRKQPNKALPSGKPPAVIYEFPENCGDYEECCVNLTKEDFEELGVIDELQPIYNGDFDDFIREDVRELLSEIMTTHNLGSVEEVTWETLELMYCFLRTEFRAQLSL